MDGDFNIDVGDVEFETDQVGEPESKPPISNNPFGNRQGISMSASADHCHFPPIQQQLSPKEEKVLSQTLLDQFDDIDDDALDALEDIQMDENILQTQATTVTKPPPKPRTKTDDPDQPNYPSSDKPASGAVG